jgi:hypothetical protein
MPAEMAEAIACNVTYALQVIERGLGEVWAGLGPRWLHLDYTAMIDQDGGFVAPLFRSLGLDVPIVASWRRAPGAVSFCRAKAAFFSTRSRMSPGSFAYRRRRSHASRQSP